MLCRYIYVVQVILCQKHSFLHQLTQNMTTDCSLNYEFNTRKLQILFILYRLKPKHLLHVVDYSYYSECQNKNKKTNLIYTTCTELVVFLYWTRNSMNNLSSYCGKSMQEWVLLTKLYMYYLFMLMFVSGSKKGKKPADVIYRWPLRKKLLSEKPPKLSFFSSLSAHIGKRLRIL